MTTNASIRFKILSASVAALLLTGQAPAGLAQDAQPDDLPRALVARGGAMPDAEHAAHGGAAALTADDLCPTGDICYDLRIRYATGRIRNPNNPKGWDNVKLRSYVGDVSDVSGAVVDQLEFVAPQVELKPGDTFRMTLHNDLAKSENMGLPWTPCEAAAPTPNDPHCANFNLTNLHSHGLWISPEGNSDNVLLTIYPETSFTYEYNIPQDHPAGTFWYHSHRHGSTGPQVASGMAGALIIRDDRAPTLAGSAWQTPGDIDRLLPRPGTAEDAAAPTFPERVMLFQQIAYACRNADGSIRRVDPNNPGSAWSCDPAADGVDPFDPDGTGGDVDKLGNIDPTIVGTVEPGPDPNNRFDLLAFNAWPQSRRHTAINGVVHKVLAPATTGTVERWRMIHAGVRQTIRLQIRKAATPEAAASLLDQALTAEAAETAVTQVCSGAPLQIVGMAADGLTRPALDPKTDTWLQPGYREDILVSFPEAGTYCLLNAPVAGADNINAIEGDPAVLGLITVTGAPAAGTSAERITDALVASAQATGTFEDEAVRDQVVADIEDGGKLSAFVKHQTIPVSEINPIRRTVGFRFAPPIFAIGGIAQDFLGGQGLASVNAQEYDHDRIDHILPLGTAEEWLLTSFGAAHPFHIHVNPFEIVEILKYQPDPAVPAHAQIDPLVPSTWVDVSVPGSGTEFAGLKGAWKDTVFVGSGFLVRMRTRYERYIGDFVLHCHILDHEDQGMMQNVRVALGNGRGGFDPHGH